MTASGSSALIDRLEAMLADGRDSALLRFSLGSEFMAIGRIEDACAHLESAVTQDPEYSAAWKLLGRACARNGQTRRAMAAFRTGIEVAEKRGDVQAAKEMTVFLRRLKKSDTAGEGRQ